MTDGKLFLSACFASALVLSGCGTTPQETAMQSSYDLCYLLAVTPPSNINRKVRLNELSSRGEDCSNYRDAIQQRIATENANANENARIGREKWAEHQRQLELEKARATKITIQNTNTTAPPPSYQCRRVGNVTQCDPY